MRNKKMKKIWGLTTAVILAASSIMAGCGNSQTAKETQPTPVQESSAAAESKVSDAQETEEAQKQAGAKTLVVYSNTDEAGAKAMEDVGKEIGIEVTVVRLNGGGEVTDRIMAEKNTLRLILYMGLSYWFCQAQSSRLPAAFYTGMG